MTELLEKALEAVRQMKPDDQDHIAGMMLSVAQIGVGDEIEPEHYAAVMEGMAQADRGEFVEGEAGDIVSRAFARARTAR